MIRTSTLGSFCPYTLPLPHSGQRSPWVRFWCLISTFRAPLNASAPVRPCPGGGGVLLSGCVPAGEFFRLIHHRFGLLCTPRLHQHLRQSMQCLFELAVIGFAQRRLTRSVQHSVQFLQIHFDAASGSLHAVPPISSRNRFVNGYPRTSLIDRLGT